MKRKPRKFGAIGNPADVGLGRRPLLGLVGGGPGRRLRDGLRAVRASSSPAAARSTSTSPSAAREERPGADGACRGVEHELPRLRDARGAALLATRCACCRPTCSSSRWSRTASASTATATGRLRHLPGAVGRRRHAEPALVPPAPAPGHAKRALRFHRCFARMRLCRRNCARAGRCPRVRHRDPALPPHRQYPGNRPSSMLFLEELDAAETSAG